MFSDSIDSEQSLLHLHVLLATFFVVAKVEFFRKTSTAVFTHERPLALVNVLLVLIEVSSLHESDTTMAYKRTFSSV
jgi:hypothetical protein